MNYEIVFDHGETANKCTIAPLRGRPDFRFFPVFGEGPFGPLSASVLLHHEGKCLTRLARAAPVNTLASVDCVWRRLPYILQKLDWESAPAIYAKIPGGFLTAYPRVGKPDPDGGLATIEAVFTAAAILGNWDLTLLSHYYFARAFVERNAKRFVELGISQAADPSQWPPPPQLQRNSHTRKVNRGRLAQKT